MSFVTLVVVSGQPAALIAPQRLRRQPSDHRRIVGEANIAAGLTGTFVVSAVCTWTVRPTARLSTPTAKTTTAVPSQGWKPVGPGASELIQERLLGRWSGPR
jgi:hypothetical protein